MRFVLGLLATSLGAQTVMPVGIVRGAWVAATASELTVRNTQNAVYLCSYDAHTYFESDHRPIAASGMAAGDPVEVLADRKFGSGACYARTVQVVYAAARSRQSVRRPPEWFTPRGDLTFGGLVARRGAGVLTLKTRNGEITFRLRADTRYSSGGLRCEPEALAVNTHVFVRGGQNLDGELEAYQVAWGEVGP